ncbi:MAG: hypothetical protein H6686_12310 [Fibrobacteria bacterium]|nr:hypothetical protein [Fibrobacteria bacterium]
MIDFAHYRSGKALSLAATLFLLSCGNGPSDVPWRPQTLSGPQTCVEGSRPDTVLAASLNLSIGFRVEDLLFIDQGSDSVVYRRVEGIYADAARSLPRERIRRIAVEIAALRPDLVGLQECLHLERDGKIVMDMLDTLRHDLDSLGLADYSLHRHALNPVDVVVGRPGGDSIHVVFHEGLATLVSPRWTVRRDVILPFKSVLSIELIGRRATSERAAQGLLLSAADGFHLESWNTHLEVLPFQRKNQATELVLVADSLRSELAIDPPAGRVLLGDLNSAPGLDADSLLTQAGWKDSWTDAGNRSRGPTCCVSNNRSATGSYETSGRRIDYVRHQGACRVDSTSVRLDSWFLTGSGDTLWTSDHGLVLARMIYGVRP